MRPRGIAYILILFFQLILLIVKCVSIAEPSYNLQEKKFALFNSFRSNRGAKIG